jgi:hypothetical protein
MLIFPYSQTTHPALRHQKKPMFFKGDKFTEGTGNYVLDIWVSCTGMKPMSGKFDISIGDDGVHMSWHQAES